MVMTFFHAYCKAASTYIAKVYSYMVQARLDGETSLAIVNVFSLGDGIVRQAAHETFDDPALLADEDLVDRGSEETADDGGDGRDPPGQTTQARKSTVGGVRRQQEEASR
jgi:hypothetical protein